MKVIGTTVRFSRNFAKLCKKNISLKAKIEKKIDLFLVSPSHPGLRLHKAVIKDDEAWSISVDTQIRVLFIYETEGIILVDIGSHDEVY